MTAREYTSSKVRKVYSTKKGRKALLGYQLILIYMEPNPDYVEDMREPEQRHEQIGRGKNRHDNPRYVEDTREPKQRMKNVARQVTRMGTAKTLKEARAEADAWREEENNKAREPEQAKGSVYELVKAYVDRRERLSEAVKWDTNKTLPNGERVITRSTVRDYKHTLNAMERDFSGKPVGELTAAYMIKWEEKQIEKSMSLSRVRKVHVLMKAALDDAVVRGLIAISPIASLKAPTIRLSDDDKGLSREDMQKTTLWLQQLEPTAVTVGAMIALHAGLRGGEVCGLRWADVDTDLRLIHVNTAIGVGIGGGYEKPPKSASGKRVVWMDDAILDMLQKRRALMLKERDNIATDFDQLFIVGNVAGGFLSPTTLSRRWTTLAGSWGLKDLRGGTCTLHGLRHSFSTAMRKTKNDVDEAKTRMSLMGHSDVRMTEHYGSRAWETEIPAVMAASAYMTPETNQKAMGEVRQFQRTGTEG